MPGAFLQLGRVGLDAASGIDVDATGREMAGLRQLLAERVPRRRAGKDLRQLDAFLNDIEIGDTVAMPIEGGPALLVGRSPVAIRSAGTAAAPVPATNGRCDGTHVSHAARLTHRRPSRIPGLCSPYVWQATPEPVGPAPSGAGGGHLSEATGLEVLDRLDDFGLGVHHEWPVPDQRLADR